MQANSVTSKGQVTIPKSVRQRLGIRQGTRVAFTVVGDCAELRIQSSPAKVASGGYGLLKSRKKPVPADFDVASLVKR